MRYILASASPRRREIFGRIEEDFEVLVPAAEESVPEGMDHGKAAMLLAETKGRAALAQFDCSDAMVVAADTVVSAEGKMLGKPKDAEDAYRMLKLLSGKTHTVYTGVALLTADGRERIFCDATEVEFYELSDKMIRDYINTNDPFDKAGAYGIQGKGCILIKGIKGDYFNVMGLPVAKLFREREILLETQEN
ncbi:MAG: septum formation protein Maf [Oscillospiraceae bacterium]|nr:septum formation protein Maf [Oscillospiraceae bacterium]